MTTWLSQTNLPALTLSYILIGACVCLGLDYQDLPTSTPGILVNSSFVPDLQWTQVIEGTVRGAGQVYGCPGFASSCLILAAILLFSPTMFLQACLGTMVGSLCGVLMQPNDLHRVYRGDYGRHSLLTALSLGGFFFVLNFYSSLVALTGAVLSAFIFQAMLKINMPVLTVPHVVTTLVLLHTRMRGGLIKRIDLVYLTFPEMHRIHPTEVNTTSYDSDTEFLTMSFETGSNNVSVKGKYISECIKVNTYTVIMSYTVCPYFHVN
ncbi:urea transporter 1-like [Penaeus monodon]|uniref:urea transporter 1-like n=1 Tax=Penaeus monodon TaxID=6687 RepID=UPI0018A7C796|nr:urea transporter 1-like [Penaeus monodon]